MGNECLLDVIGGLLRVVFKSRVFLIKFLNKPPVLVKAVALLLFLRSDDISLCFETPCFTKYSRYGDTNSRKILFRIMLLKRDWSRFVTHGNYFAISRKLLAKMPDIK